MPTNSSLSQLDDRLLSPALLSVLRTGQRSVCDLGTVVPALPLVLGDEGCAGLAVPVPFLGTLPLYSESQAEFQLHCCF